MQNIKKYAVGNGILTDGQELFIEDAAILIEMNDSETSDTFILSESKRRESFTYPINKRSGKIVKIGKTAEIKPLAPEFIDVQGRLILPGFVIPHHHLYSFLAVGLAPIGEINNFVQNLKNFWWHLDKNLNAESVYYSALLGLIEAVKNGVTTIFDHHASMNYVKGSLAKIASAFSLSGIQGVLCLETSDRAGETQVTAQIEENLDFYNSHKESENLRGMFGLHANFTLSNSTLEKISKQKPKNLPIHAHCGEDKADFDFCVKQGFAGPVQRLDKFGLITKDSILCHCIHISDKDSEVLQRLKPFIVTNPESNAKNRVGKMNRGLIKDYLIGTDGMTSDMLVTLRSQYLLGEGHKEDFAELRRIFFGNTQKLRSAFFPDSLGFRVGSRADIAVLDYRPITPINLDNLLGHLIFGCKGGKAFITIANGKIIWADNEIKFTDESAAIAEGKKAALALHSAFTTP